MTKREARKIAARLMADVLMAIDVVPDPLEFPNEGHQRKITEQYNVIWLELDKEGDWQPRRSPRLIPSIPEAVPDIPTDI